MNGDLANFISGGASKFISTLATFPYTTIKVNQQGNKKKRSIITTALMIYISFGFKGFYKGLSSKLLYTILSMAIMTLVYNRLKKKLKRKIYAMYLKSKLKKSSPEKKQ